MTFSVDQMLEQAPQGRLELEDGDVVSGVYLLSKISHLDGDTSLHREYVGVNWLERIGMLNFALQREADTQDPE